MGAAGRLARGEANFNSKKFMNNAETLEYMATLEKPKEVKKVLKKVEVKREVKEKDGN
jgi:hypothetical protein